jgi:hypothetical protein
VEEPVEGRGLWRPPSAASARPLLLIGSLVILFFLFLTSHPLTMFSLSPPFSDTVECACRQVPILHSKASRSTDRIARSELGRCIDVT